MFEAARDELGELPLIAEDLGVITPAVDRLRDDLGLPGIVVLQFGFNPGDARNTHDVDNHREHAVAYTGTHDNDTVRGWYESLTRERRALVERPPGAPRRGVVGPDRAVVLVARRAPRWCRRRTCSASGRRRA